MALIFFKGQNFKSFSHSRYVLNRSFIDLIFLSKKIVSNKTKEAEKSALGRSHDYSQNPIPSTLSHLVKCTELQKCNETN